MNVFITGTSSGLGLGLALYYLKKGHSVYGVSRRQKEELSSNQNYTHLVQDLSDFDETGTRIEKFLAGIKTLDLVILNAGMLNEIKDLHETDIVEIKRVMDVNVWANKLLIDKLFKQIPAIKQLVAISSGASVSGARGWNAYSLSKATLNMLINLYAKEFTSTHFCALAPGLIDSAMQDYIYKLEKYDDFPVVQKLKKAKGTDQMPNHQDAAKLVANAISDLQKFESGSFQDVRKM
ncbi:SDR family NAD(P)-dependent oxidoreductase [Sunxiuqinia indica]|uniref:SDR family NAD(P)-dependent oxidoreductase n=1 Tax=Sunxiuqinia indica TaxID=2692584 RepID=UPI0013580272|nr:SDR family NAD(P)-dependent oxidoreductase [Sunxiuqinia indica]